MAILGTRQSNTDYTWTVIQKLFHVKRGEPLIVVFHFCIHAASYHGSGGEVGVIHNTPLWKLCVGRGWGQTKAVWAMMAEFCLTDIAQSTMNFLRSPPGQNTIDYLTSQSLSHPSCHTSIYIWKGLTKNKTKMKLNKAEWQKLERYESWWQAKHIKQIQSNTGFESCGFSAVGTLISVPATREKAQTRQNSWQ